MAEYIKADTGTPIETVTLANGQEFTANRDTAWDGVKFSHDVEL